MRHAITISPGTWLAIGGAFLAVVTSAIVIARQLLKLNDAYAESELARQRAEKERDFYRDEAIKLEYALDGLRLPRPDGHPMRSGPLHAVPLDERWICANGKCGAMATRGCASCGKRYCGLHRCWEHPGMTYPLACTIPGAG